MAVRSLRDVLDELEAKEGMSHALVDSMVPTKGGVTKEIREALMQHELRQEEKINQ